MTTRRAGADAAVATPREDVQGRRWLVLAVGLAAIICGCALQYGLAYLIPALQAEGMTLGQASIVVVAPVLGVLVGLLPWGYAADRTGERVVLSIGLALSGVAGLAAAAVSPSFEPLIVCLFLAGAAGSSIHAASGRLILGWFAARERGLAMGIRQTGQPLGIALAAFALPVLAMTSVSLALAVLGILCIAAAGVVALLVSDPVRPSPAPGATAAPRAASPYRTSRYLPRIHLASGLLVVPQFAITVFSFEYLVSVRGWAPADAGIVLAFAQFGAAAIRLLAGAWSDRAHSRLRPMVILCLVSAAVLGALAAATWAGSDLAVVALVAAATFTSSTNGLAFAAVAERAGMGWAGRALGFQNTVQNATGVVTPPIIVAIIALGSTAVAGYALAFLIIAIIPVVAGLIVPVRGEGAI